MKRFLSFLAAASLLVGFTACSDSDPEPDPIPPTKEEVIKEIFPGGAPTFVANENAAAEEAQPGEAIALPTFKAAYKWTMKVEEVASLAAKASFSREGEATSPFLLSLYANGDGATTELAGAGDGKEVQVYLITPEKAPIDGDISADVTLTMETSATTSEVYTLYKAYVGELDLHFTLEGVQFDNGEWVYGEDGTWAYEEIKGAAEDEESAIELYWLEGGSWYNRWIRIAADFDFEVLSAPEWLTIAQEKTEDGVYTASLRAATTKIADPKGTIVFRHKEYTEVTLAYNITIPNYGEIFDLIPGSAFKFDTEGNPITDDSTLGSTTKWFSTVDGGKAYVFEKVSEGWSSYYQLVTEDSWIHFNAEDTTDEADDYIRTINASISVDANEGFAAREGVVLYLPPFAFEKLEFDESWFADGLDDATILGVLSDYVFGTVWQEGKEILSITEEEREQYENEFGIFFTPCSDGWPSNIMDFKGAYGYYDLVFTDSWNNDDYAPLHLDAAYAGKDITFKYYDGEAFSIDEYDDDEPTAPNWLQAKSLGMDGTNLRFFMYPKYDTFNSPDYAHEGFVVVLSDNKPIAVVHCIFDENFIPGGGDQPGTSTEISFVDPDDHDGADLIPISENNVESVFGVNLDTYKEFEAAGVKMIGLSFWGTQTATLNVPAGYYVMHNPYNITWLDYGLEYGEYSKSTMTITMKAPAEDEAKFGSIQFAASLSSSFPDVIIFCKPAFAD